MDILIFVFEIIGTVAFSVSGAMTGLKKNMDIFGVMILGVITAIGGGVIRDLVHGITPPLRQTRLRDSRNGHRDNNISARRAPPYHEKSAYP